ncbi:MULTISPECIES: type II toxin-antitoxin system RelE/ParE family toxin [Nitrospirillum]|uniref:ParE-like toxin of type II ParDE toxin-antitoxin system n=2 Tax=Nitrospirillum amazonense TaxID=28077 RepID=A0A560FB56_9PROT|nr:type II toxin-antitoxin system RelE/ParE family toxin [Nitrospirillum amazonense]MEC4595020.1 type II toxin-antitoxin system RelE/ParE family toxin [Nitrospirillum amazonense]TWB18848.1 ParE-like toxin of type II ParDE toxin-antitoxin system [Nitrospirillum amazonense]
MTYAANRDLAAARDWLQQPGAGVAAENRLIRISAAIKELKTAPCRWPVGDHAGIRERPVEGYLVMYRVEPDTDNNQTAGNV